MRSHALCGLALGVLAAGAWPLEADVPVGVVAAEAAATADPSALDESVEGRLAGLLAEAEALAADPGVPAEELERLGGYVAELRGHLEEKAVLVEQGAPTGDVDARIGAVADELEALSADLAARAAPTEPAADDAEPQPSPPADGVLATVGKALADASRILERIDEGRSASRTADEADTEEAADAGEEAESAPLEGHEQDTTDPGGLDGAAGTTVAGPAQTAADGPIRVKKAPVREPVRVGAPRRVGGPSPSAAPAGSLRGRIVDARTGRAVAGARVRAVGSGAAVSNRAGAFRLSGLAARRHRVRVTAPGFAAVERVVIVRRSREAMLTVKLTPLGAARRAPVRVPR